MNDPRLQYVPRIIWMVSFVVVAATIAVGALNRHRSICYMTSIAHVGAAVVRSGSGWEPEYKEDDVKNQLTQYKPWQHSSSARWARSKNKVYKNYERENWLQNNVNRCPVDDTLSTYDGEVIEELRRGIASYIVEGMGVQSCDDKHSQSGNKGENAYRPEPGEWPDSSLIAGRELHIRWFWR